MIVSIIAALTDNRVIGRRGQLPWHLPPDLKRFKAITLGHTVIMGRKTFESSGRPLKGRDNIVVSQKLKIQGGQDFAPGTALRQAGSLDQALALSPANDEVFVIGGTRIFAEALERDLVHRMYLTLIHKSFPGDTYFPQYDAEKFTVLAKTDHHEPFPFTYLDLQRIGSAPIENRQIVLSSAPPLR